MKEKNKIYLIGPLGAGKSTVGRGLARSLRYQYFDTDRVIEERLGVDLSWIFDLEGEEGFRKRELALLKELSEKENIVVATGGGTILIPEARKLLADTGMVIYLRTSLSKQIKRTQRNQYNRPLLRGTNLKERLLELQEQREPLYQEIADKTFFTSDGKIAIVVKQIVKFIKSL